MSLQDLKKKMKGTQKSGPGRASARVRETPPNPPAKVEKLPKVLRSLVEAITDDDLDLVLQVWREAMTATRSFWRETGRDPETKKSIGAWIEEPDHKTRLEASKLFAAYKEGLPVQRQVQLTGSLEDMNAVAERARQSPETMRMLEMLGGMGVQETGSAIDVESTREDGQKD